MKLLVFYDSYAFYVGRHNHNLTITIAIILCVFGTRKYVLFVILILIT